ncbi:Oidioi.mRNA.OKI2018_I69.chr1.g19.t1.cds [Oikopleura dioica]|uniref:Oidioi.mRNA.OKI2018_I69.chr1.g19.t1.cds n=1 Tax=Oikopleura dioica TaxID=34765 RepID=A0ABN7SNN0_OIKDI|nr:Oidioi.mRNA.OKI2018_I69.chr1.g19.t1.cds [Oikopleura dioica]
MTRFPINLSGGEVATTKIPTESTSTSSVSPCELVTELTTVNNQADPIEATNFSWLKQAVFTAAVTSTLWFFFMIYKKYEMRIRRSITDCCRSTLSRDRKDPKDNRSEEELKTKDKKPDVKNERSKNDEEIREQVTTKKKKDENWTPGPDWMRLNRLWRAKKKEEQSRIEETEPRIMENCDFYAQYRFDYVSEEEVGALCACRESMEEKVDVDSILQIASLSAVGACFLLMVILIALITKKKPATPKRNLVISRPTHLPEDI